MNARRFRACALLVGLFAAEIAWAQAGVAGSPPPSAEPQATEDPLGRTTPRGTVRGFLAAEGKGDSATATRYLNTRLRGEAAVVLAHQLFVVMNDRLPARLNEISDQPQGSLYYPTEPDKDLIGTTKSDAGDIEIVVERIESKKLGSVWLFSRSTLDAIPELYAEVKSEPESAFAKFLLETKIARIALIHWLAVFIGLPLFHFLCVRLDRSLSSLTGRLLRRLRKNPDLPNPEVLPVPIRLLLLAVLIRWALSAFTLPLLPRQFWSGIAALAAIGGVVWLSMRLTGWFETKMRFRLDRLNLTGALSMLRFARSAVNVLVLFVALLVVLHYFGINPTTALAGLGVGGIAVALAAQKTLENLIAGIALISDKAIRVGDFLKISGTFGTVTDIGLRSTRIRTLDRTVLNVPNGQIANASLENLSLRDQFWFHHILGLTQETRAGQIRSILDGVTESLAQRRDVKHDAGWVRLLRFGGSSFDVEIFAYVSALDWRDFLRVQEELLLQVMDIIEAAGAKICLPAQLIHLNTDLDGQPSVEDEDRMAKRRLPRETRTTKPAGDAVVSHRR